VPTKFQLILVVLADKPEPLVSVPVNVPVKLYLVESNTRSKARPSQSFDAVLKDAQTLPKLLVAPFTHDADPDHVDAPPALTVPGDNK